MDAMLEFDQLQTPVWIYDTVNFRIHWANTSAIKLWQAGSLSELVGRDFRSDSSDAVYQTLLSYLAEFEKGKTISRWWRLNPNGNPVQVFCRFSGIRLDDGHMAMLVEGIEQNEQLISPEFSGGAIVVLADEQGDLISVSPYLKENFAGHIRTLNDLLQYPEQADVLLQIVITQGYHQEDIKVKTLNGSCWYSIELRRIETDGKPRISITLQDIHARKNRELEHQAMALLDPLTGALNRNGLSQQVQPLIEHNKPFALFYLDLDGFKPINDSYGHGVGDQLLNKVTSRLIKAVEDRGIVARIGGDEFVVVISRELLEVDKHQFADLLLSAVSGQYKLDDSALSVALSASLGLSCFPEHDSNFSLLLANADAAMYAAKGSGRRRWIEYRKGMREKFQRTSQVSQLLNGALADGRLSMEYQPVIDSQSGKPVIVEALLRWGDPGMEAITPEELIEAAEQGGLIGELSHWIYHQACQDFARIKPSMPEGVKLSVNVSALHIMQGGFLASLLSAIEKAGLKPGDLVLELTEKVMLPSAPEYRLVVPKLIKKGFDLAIDDFGTGFSSLAYLHSIPAQWVKLDREFVQQLGQGCETVVAIHQLVSQLGMKMIVEGVEEDQQVKRLSQNGIYLLQGYYLARPCLPDQLHGSYTQSEQVVT